MPQPEITCYLKTHCGWSEGVRAIMRKYDLSYQEKDIIANPAQRVEMEQKSGQKLSPCVIVDGTMLADVSGEEVEQWMVENGHLEQSDEAPDAPIDSSCSPEDHAKKLAAKMAEKAAQAGQAQWGWFSFSVGQQDIDSMSDSFAQFRQTGEGTFSIGESSTLVDPIYSDKADYKEQLRKLRKGIDDRQQLMYADDRHAMLLVFQAMDAAGKDGTIRTVLAGVNPHGVQIHSFKRPTAIELDHNYMWRTDALMPRRGHIGVFNRSYYEEVLVVRVHPEILTDYQRLPEPFTKDLDAVWKQRHADIRGMEAYNHHNGTKILKFFLNLSKDEQARRFLSRIDRPEKNWKFEPGDIRERASWDQYMKVYEETINETSTPESPWFVIPADDKKNMRLLVANIVLEELNKLDMNYPDVDAEKKEAMVGAKVQLEKELG